MGLYHFKFAEHEQEIEQIHRLNYAAFVDEIPQHAPNPARRLVDQFHGENTYAIGLLGDEVIAMLALRAQRPFSLDKKVANVDSYLPPHHSPCEIRLLYIRPGHRNGKVLRGLMELVGRYAMAHEHDIALISGTTRQQKLYRHFGFEPFGPLVGQEPARFQPMYLTLAAAIRHAPWLDVLTAMIKSQDTLVERPRTNGSHLPHYDPPRNYLPGPVNIPDVVLAAMSRVPISHRHPQFLTDVARLQARLCERVQARYVDLLVGSSTLANEAIAAQLVRLGEPGLVLVNGEFGRRLADQVVRWHLPHQVIEAQWGCAFDLDVVRAALDLNPSIGWLWCNHCETSTGMLNDIVGLGELCKQFGIRFCVDCISSIGAVPIDLGDVFLASGTSGKALGAVAGLALVFSNEMIDAAPTDVPSYLDLGLYRAASGVPFTMPTNLVYALDAALDCLGRDTYARTVAAATTLRDSLRRHGFQLVVPDDLASPAVTTIALPREVVSTEVGDRLAAHGFLTTYHSRYLVAHNWLQICLMGAFRTDALQDLVTVLHRAVSTRAAQNVITS